MDEPLATLLLPAQLETFALETHARELLSIPRVIALEPSRFRTPRFMREATTARQAARLRLPGRLRVVVLYHPAQYPLARALRSRHEDAELWYIPADPTSSAAEDGDLRTYDALARDRATATLEVTGGGTEIEDEPLRRRLRELEVISPRAFVPGARFGRAERRR